MNITKAFILFFFVLNLELASLEKEPWLGNWLEFVGSVSQEHTQSSSVDTKDGTKNHFLHKEKTSLSCAFMPLVDFEAEVELDFAKTQKKAYGFDAIKAACRYKLLDDLASDPVSLTANLVAALSTPSRVKDLSSTQHGVFDTEAQIAVGRQFFLQELSYYKAWALFRAGVASSGSPWLGFEAHLGRTLHDVHTFDLFFRAAKGTSSRPLKRIADFHSWSKIGYEYEELGISYSLNEVGFGSVYIEARKRIRARYCPKAVWSIQLGVCLPFSVL